MAGDGQTEGLNSRYLVEQILGEYPPWRGYRVSDALSEKKYLLFSLSAPAQAPVSLDDLKMRDFLFARGDGIASPTLSLQRMNGNVTFLLPAAELIPLMKALPSVQPVRADSIMKLLVTQVLARHREGLFFHNLTPESLYVSNEALGVLPTAYLLPREILELTRKPRNAAERPLDAMSEDLRMLGGILSHFSLYADHETAEGTTRIAARLAALGPESGAAEYFGAIEDLLSLVEADDRGSLTPRARIFHSSPPAQAMAKMKQIAEKARAGERQLVIVRGKCGEGRSRFVAEVARALEGEWGLANGSIVSDQTLFENFGAPENGEETDFCVIDDHTLEPLLSCHVMDRVSRAIEHSTLVVIATDGEPPAHFMETLREELARRGSTLREVDLPRFSASEKAKIVAQMTAPETAKRLHARLDHEEPLAIAACRTAALASSEEPAGKATAFLDLLAPEERSVLNFIAAFSFDMPLAFLLGVYAPEETSIYAALQRLLAIGAIRSRAEASSLAGGELAVVYGASSRAVAEAALAGVSADRRKQIHGNIARLLEERAGAPTVYSFYHLAMSGNRAAAGLKGFEILELLIDHQKSAALACFQHAYMDEKLDRALPAELRLKLLLDLGTAFSITGSMERAEACFRKCREEATREPDAAAFRDLAVEASRRECEILEKRGEFTKAEKLLEKVIDAHGEDLPATERAKLYHDVAWLNYRLGAFDESWKNCLRVHKILDGTKCPAESAQAYNLMGTINWNRSKYDEAVLCFKRCLAIREECNDEMGIAVTYNNLGLVYLSLGSLQEALECFTKSMEIKERHNNLPGLAAAHHNIALVYLDLDRIREAEKNCLAATRLAEEIGNQQLLAESYGTMGDIAFLQGNYEKARSFYRKDLHLCDKTKSLREKAITYRRLGELHLAQGNLGETAEMLEQARTYNQKIGSRLETVLLNLLEGRILLAKGKVEEGRCRLEGAALELSLLGKRGAAASVAAEIGMLHFGDGNEPLARECLLRANSLVREGESPPKQVRLLQDSLDRRSEAPDTRIGSDADRFRVLCRVTSLLRTIGNTEKLYAAIVETVRKATGMERAALVVKVEGRDTPKVLAETGGFSPGTFAADKSVSAVLTTARQLGCPIDSSRNRVLEEKVSDDFLKAHPRVICMPLKVLDEVAGYFYLDGPTGEAPTSDDDQSFLVAMSQQLALALERFSLAGKVRELETSRPNAPVAPRPKERASSLEIVGDSVPMKRIYELVDSIKDMDTTVLLTGSNGTGKDLIAKMIHYRGPRAGRPFVALNCAAFAETLLDSELFGHEKGAFTNAFRQRIGHFESANGGTIFLNEIGDLPLTLQPKLLHVLEEKKFYRVGGTMTISTDVRIITATNKDLRSLVDQGRFREDLYHRINIFPIRIPDLKERTDDIEPLCAHFLSTYCRLYGVPPKRISPEAMARLVAYDWPGNVRELENIINRLIIVSKRDTILPEDIPEYIVRKPETVKAQLRATLEETIDSLLETLELSTTDPILPKVEGCIVSKVVERIGDKTKAAALLGISKPTVYSKLKKYGKAKDM